MTQRDAKDTMFLISRATSNDGRTLATNEAQPTFLFLYALLCLVAQSCTTLCNPIDCSPPGSSVHGILQARILEWVAIPSSRLFRYIQPQIKCNSHFSLAICGGTNLTVVKPSSQDTRQDRKKIIALPGKERTDNQWVSESKFMNQNSKI